jgi:hypothetical protein
LAGKSPPEAVQNFLDPLRLALSCVTRDVLQVSGYHVADVPHAVTLGRGLPVRLGGDSRLSLTVTHNYRIIEDPGPRGPYKCSTTSYVYALDDDQSKEVISYQWHPSGRSHVTWPHLHLGAGAHVERHDLSAAHLPTGRISIEEMLRLAIDELGVEPLRADWRDVMDTSQVAHEKWRTWPQPSGSS